MKTRCLNCNKRLVEGSKAIYCSCCKGYYCLKCDKKVRDMHNRRRT